MTTTSQMTIYIAPAGGTPTRVAGLGDNAAPSGGGAAGTFTSFNFGPSPSINANGQVLLQATAVSGAEWSLPGIDIRGIWGAKHGSDQWRHRQKWRRHLSLE